MQMPCLSYGRGVCLSVCPSARPCDSIKTTQAKITKSSLSAPRKTLLPGSVKCFQKFERSHPDRGREIKRVEKNCEFKPISRRISETVRDSAKVTITNRKSHKPFRLLPKSTTFGDPERSYRILVFWSSSRKLEGR